MAFIFALNADVTVVVARRKGEQNAEAANKALRQSILISLSVSIIMSLLGYLFAKQIMYFAGLRAIR